MTAPILFSFPLPVCYAHPIYIYIYIICVPRIVLQHLIYTGIYIALKKMATFLEMNFS